MRNRFVRRSPNVRIRRPPRPFRFELILEGPPEAMTEAAADALFEAGCDDGLCGVTCGVPTVAFTREAPTWEHAVATAVRDVGAAGFQVREARIHGADLNALGSDRPEPAAVAA